MNGLVSIARLTAMVPPPRRPFEVERVDRWRTVEVKLGLTLPTDYQDFIFAYGSGLFARFYRIYNPFAASELTNLATSIDRVCRALNEIKRDWPEQVPHSIYPDSPGLLPWGNDENGNDYYWLTLGPPNTWHVVSDEVRGEGLRHYECNMTDFLSDILTGKITALAGDYPHDQDRIFKPWAE